MFLNICGKTIEKIFQGSVVVVIYISCLSLLCCHASSLPAGIVLISRLSCVLCFLVFCYFPIWCSSQEWSLMASIPDLCPPIYF